MEELLEILDAAATSLDAGLIAATSLYLKLFRVHVAQAERQGQHVPQTVWEVYVKIRDAHRGQET